MAAIVKKIQQMKVSFTSFVRGILAPVVEDVYMASRASRGWRN